MQIDYGYILSLDANGLTEYIDQEVTRIIESISGTLKTAANPSTGGSFKEDTEFDAVYENAASMLAASPYSVLENGFADESTKINEKLAWVNSLYLFIETMNEWDVNPVIKSIMNYPYRSFYEISALSYIILPHSPGHVRGPNEIFERINGMVLYRGTSITLEDAIAKSFHGLLSDKEITYIADEVFGIFGGECSDYGKMHLMTFMINSGCGDRYDITANFIDLMQHFSQNQHTSVRRLLLNQILQYNVNSIAYKNWVSVCNDISVPGTTYNKRSKIICPDAMECFLKYSTW